MPQQRTPRPSGSRPEKSIEVSFDLATALDLADYFIARDKPESALKTLHAVAQLNPHDTAVREKFAGLLYRCREGQFALGTVERSRFLLHVIGFDCRLPEIQAAYFDNLRAVLRSRPSAAARGTLVLGLGPGRCGSTTLADMVGQSDRCCATHENPPLVHWEPRAEQLAFHKERFALLLDHFPVVFDAAHWWLNAAETMLEAFPDLRLVALMRDPDACARSFLEVKGTGPGSLNHWTDHDGHYWKPALWDSLYPSYQANEFAEAPSDFADAEAVGRLQFEMVRRYAADYNDAVRAWQEALEDKILVVPTDQLSDPACQERIYRFIGVEGGPFAAVRNRGTLDDGSAQALKF